MSINALLVFFFSQFCYSDHAETGLSLTGDIKKTLTTHCELA